MSMCLKEGHWLERRFRLVGWGLRGRTRRGEHRVAGNSGGLQMPGQGFQLPVSVHGDLVGFRLPCAFCRSLVCDHTVL